MHRRGVRCAHRLLRRLLRRGQVSKLYFYLRMGNWNDGVFLKHQDGCRTAPADNGRRGGLLGRRARGPRRVRGAQDDAGDG